MTKARTNADNVAGDISGVTAGTGLSGGGTSGTVTISADTAVVATTNNTLTMSGKTLTMPRFASGGEIDDANGNELIKFPATVASAINEITVTNATTSGTPSISATGDDTNISLNLVPKGTGTVQAGGVAVATTSGTQTLTNKTLSGATLTGTLTAGGGTGSSGQVLQSTGTGVQWGSAGITWTQRSIGANVNFNKIEYNGTNLYVGVGNAGNLYTSPDAITWTSRTSGFGANSINSVAFGNGLWVAVGDNGTITTSTDGITWTTRTSNVSTNTIYSVTYANSTWVAVAQGGGTINTGGIIYSSDGITWTRRNQSLSGVDSNYFSVIWNGTNWIVGTGNSTNNYIYASTPAGTWTGGQDGTNASIGALFYDGTRTILHPDNGAFRFSTSATIGTSTGYIRNISVSPARQNAYLYNGVIHVANVYYQTLTPTSNQFPTLSSVSLSPAAAITLNSPFLTNYSSCIWAGAAGIIIAAGGGYIFTSF